MCIRDSFWKGVQDSLARRDLPDFYPYAEGLRFHRRPTGALG